MEGKESSYSLHILMWNINNQQTIFVKDVILEDKLFRELANVRDDCADMH